MVAVAWPRPMPLVSRVMQIEPPPMPTLTKSAPASARKRKPSRSTTLPVDLDVVAVVLADPFDGHLLPVGEAFGGVDAQHVGAGLDQGGNALGVVAGVDACAHDVALLGVEHLERVVLVGIVVLTEGHVDQVVPVVDQRKAVELVVPDDVVGLFEGGLGGSHDELLARGHEVADLGVEGHAGQAVVALGHHAEQLAVGLAVVGDGHGGMARGLLELENLLKRHIGRKGGVRSPRSRPCAA